MNQGNDKSIPKLIQQLFLSIRINTVCLRRGPLVKSGKKTYCVKVHFVLFMQINEAHKY